MLINSGAYIIIKKYILLYSTFAGVPYQPHSVYECLFRDVRYSAYLSHSDHEWVVGVQHVIGQRQIDNRLCVDVQAKVSIIVAGQ